jgi:hypothetical protein
MYGRLENPARIEVAVIKNPDRVMPKVATSEESAATSLLK